MTTTIALSYLRFNFQFADSQPKSDRKWMFCDLIFGKYQIRLVEYFDEWISSNYGVGAEGVRKCSKLNEFPLDDGWKAAHWVKLNHPVNMKCFAC